MNLGMTAVILAFIMILTIGFFCLSRTGNIIRSLIALEVMLKGATAAFAFAGYYTGNFLPMQFFIIMMISMELVLVLIGSALAVKIYQKTGLLNLREIEKSETDTDIGIDI